MGRPTKTFGSTPRAQTRAKRIALIRRRHQRMLDKRERDMPTDAPLLDDLPDDQGDA